VSARAAALRTATEQGWSVSTLLDVVLDFVHLRDEDAVFIHYLSERAAADNREQMRSDRTAPRAMTDVPTSYFNSPRKP